jgi:protein-S-isoprenylcysteine O-methyltransferase Ste14
MITGIFLTALLGIIILAFFVMDFYFMLRYDRERLSGKSWSWDYTLMVGSLGAIIILQPIFLPSIGLHLKPPIGWVILVLGVTLAFLSFLLHIWSRLHLQKYYAERVEVQSDHKIINTGPYALVRHPLITSFFMLVLGVLFISPALTTLAATIYVFLDFGQAAIKEEELLRSKIPEYAQYMKQVPRFFPRLKK